MEITIPEFCLVMLMGASGAGKSHFARQNFSQEDILALSEMKSLVANQASDQSARADASETLAFVLKKRLQRGLLTVVDANHINQKSRKDLRIIAKKFHCDIITIVLDLPAKTIQERLEKLGLPQPLLLKQQVSELRQSLKTLKSEGIRHYFHLETEEAIQKVQIKARLMKNNFKDVKGPFDIIGDVHGCLAELIELLQKLGYQMEPSKAQLSGYRTHSPKHRKLLFVGDLVDRGPDSPGVLKLVMDLVKDGIAICVPGNHDDKLRRFLQGRNVKLKHGLELTAAQLETESKEFKTQVVDFIGKMASHIVLDGGKLVIAHAGLKSSMHGRRSGEERSFCLYGETNGETDEFGLPVRLNWAAEYDGKAMVVYGHTPIPEAIWLNNTIDIDTGCVFGGKLTALRYPEKEFIAVAAKRTYSEPKRPLGYYLKDKEQVAKEKEYLEFERIAGPNLVTTRLSYYITLKQDVAPAVLQVLVQNKINPKWLIHLPVHYSPPKSSQFSDFLEHPGESYRYYEKKGLSTVILQNLPHGHHCTLVLCKNEGVARNRFGIVKEGIGLFIGKNSSPIFEDREAEQLFLKNIRDQIGDAWSDLGTDWIAVEGIFSPFLPLGKAMVDSSFEPILHGAKAELKVIESLIEKGKSRGIELDKVQAELSFKEAQLMKYEQTISELKRESKPVFTALSMLAIEGKVLMCKDFVSQLAMLEGLCQTGEAMQLPDFRLLELDSESEKRAANQWWEQLPKSAGLLVRPVQMEIQADKDLYQPGLKVRSREGLRLIYGLYYNHPKQLAELRKRGLKDRRMLSARQWALSYEALSRFTEKKSTMDVLECCMAQMAIGTGSVDPRL